MSFESAFLDLMPDTVTVSALSGVNMYGEETFGSTGTDYRARVVWQPKVVTDQFGDEVVSVVTVYLASTSIIDATSQITLPDGSTPGIINISRYPDCDGLHHQTLYLGGA